MFFRSASFLPVIFITVRLFLPFSWFPLQLLYSLTFQVWQLFYSLTFPNLSDFQVLWQSRRRTVCGEITEGCLSSCPPPKKAFFLAFTWPNSENSSPVSAKWGEREKIISSVVISTNFSYVVFRKIPWLLPKFQKITQPPDFSRKKRIFMIFPRFSRFVDTLNKTSVVKERKGKKGKKNN